MTQPPIKVYQLDPVGTGVGALLIRDSNGLIPIEKTKLSTGTFIGGQVSLGTLSGSPLTTTKVSVSAGSGIIVDNYTDPENPTYQLVTWNAFTDVEVINIISATKTHLAIGVSGSPSPTLLQQTTDFTFAQHRDYIIIGSVDHVNNTNVISVQSNPIAAFDSTMRLHDLGQAIGLFNVNGNIFSDSGANLAIDKSSGQSYRIGSNFHTNKASPDVSDDIAETDISWNYTYQNGTGGSTLTGPVSAVDPDFYDDGSGILAPVTNNDWQVQMIKHFPVKDTHRHHIEYGQTIYNTKVEALAALPDITHVHDLFEEGIIRAYLVVMEGATDLSDTAQAEFIEAGKFGIAGGTGGSGVGTEGNNYELQTATVGQSVFNLTFSFSTTSGGRTYIQTFVNGVKQFEGISYDFTRTGASQITFNTTGSPAVSALLSNDVVEFYGL